MSYNVGDLVTIRDDLRHGFCVDGYYITRSMAALAGKTVKILKAWGNLPTVYYAEGTDCFFY